MVSKKLSSKASVTIPKNLRLDLGWNGGMAVDLTPTDDGGLLIKPHIDVCRFCGATDNVKNYHGVCICADCAEKMVEVVSNGDK